MTPIPIRTLCFAFATVAAACSSPKRDTAAAADSSALAAQDRTRADGVQRVVASDTTRLPNDRLRIKVTEDVPHRSPAPLQR